VTWRSLPIRPNYAITATGLVVRDFFPRRGTQNDNKRADFSIERS
jgi:hypothetical protein